MDIIQSIVAVRKDQDGQRPRVTVTSDSLDEITWHDGNPTNITNQQILDKQVELKAAYDALEYSRDRKKEYPQLKEFVEAYTEKEIGENSTKWNAYVTAYNKVRSDNPKD